jgi:hypothetical protein
MADKTNSLRYFAENYLKITDPNGNEVKLKEADFRLLDMMDNIMKNYPNAEVKRVWCRNHYEYVVISK